MKRFFFGGSCLGLVALCMISAFILLLVGSVLFTQSQVSSGLHDPAPVQPSKPAPTATPSSPNNPPSSDAQIGVTIESLTQPATSPQPSISDSPSADSSSIVNPTEAPFMTATPGNAPLDADIYQLTLTAQIVVNRTKGAAERQ